VLRLSWLVCSVQNSQSFNRELPEWLSVLAGTVARASTAPVRARRMEAYNKRGKQLNGLNIADCAGGPHELRGLVRNELQSTLAAQLADGVVRTSTGVKGVSHFDEGAARPAGRRALVQGVRGAAARCRVVPVWAPSRVPMACRARRGAGGWLEHQGKGGRGRRRRHEQGERAAASVLI